MVIVVFDYIQPENSRNRDQIFLRAENDMLMKNIWGLVPEDCRFSPKEMLRNGVTDSKCAVSFRCEKKKKKTSLKAQFLCSGFLCLVHNLLIWRIAEHWKKIIVSFRVRYVMNWKVLNHSMLFSPSNPRFQTSYHHSTSCFVDKRTALVSNL